MLEPAGRRCLRSRVALLLTAVLGCDGTLDAGRDRPTLDVSSDAGGASDSDDGPATVTDMSGGSPTTPGEDDVPPTAEPPVDASTPESPEEPLPATDAGGSNVPPEASVDAGGEVVDSPLPVDARNPIIIVNDHPRDNWLGELAVLASSQGLIDLAGIVVNTSDYSPDLEFNRSGWQEMLDAASASGLSDVPEMVTDVSNPLMVPANEEIDATSPNDSMGARFIVDAANTLGTPELPLVVINGGTLTDVADAYLLDPSIAERMVVVAALGWAFDGGAVIGGPNGELDTWAGVIVAQRLRFVQVSAFYDQVQDVTEAQVGRLPDNPFGAWMAAKRGEITNPAAADHVALLAVARPSFIRQAQRVEYTGRNPQGEALLEFRQDGSAWFVAEGDAEIATAFLWELLEAPGAFGP